MAGLIYGTQSKANNKYGVLVKTVCKPALGYMEIYPIEGQKLEDTVLSLLGKNSRPKSSDLSRKFL
jgi:hypothetical protein